MNVKISDLNDYPPRINVDFFPSEEDPLPVELKVMGLEDEPLFMIANECKLCNVWKA